MGTLETPQDRHRYIHRTGSPEWNRQTEVQVEQGAQEAMAEQGAREAMAEQGAREAMAEQGAQEAKAGGPWWPWPRPSARPQQPGPLYPPKKITMGQLRGTRSPPGLNTHTQYLKRPRSLSGQIRPRPAGLSIRQRPAGETITGWLDK